MTPEQRKFRTNAGRELLADSLLLVRHATRNLEDVARTGSPAQLMAALEQWDKAIEEVQKARKACEDLLGEEVEAWMKES